MRFSCENRFMEFNIQLYRFPLTEKTGRINAFYHKLIERFGGFYHRICRTLSDQDDWRLLLWIGPGVKPNQLVPDIKRYGILREKGLAKDAVNGVG